MDTRTDLNNNNENTVTNFQRELTIEDWKVEDKQPDIIYIGAGPLGLLSAIDIMLKSLKGLCPPISITMFEKYRKPLRTQRLDIDPNTYRLIEETPEFNAIVNQIPAKVVIKDLEQALRDFAISIGIKIIYEEVKNFDELEARYPETKYFVGSGGVHGIVHPQVFNSEKSYDEAIRYAADVRYSVEGSAEYLSRTLVLPTVLKRTQHMIFEHVGQKLDAHGNTSISLRVFVEKDTYDAMKDATSKYPYRISLDLANNKAQETSDRAKTDSYLLWSTEIYLAARRNLAAEKIVNNEIFINMLGLRFRAVKQFCTERNGKYIFQLGEEGYACPFQLSLVDNAKMLPHFSKTVMALHNNEMIELPKSKFSSVNLFAVSSKNEFKPQKLTPIEYYQNFATNYIQEEHKKISLYNKGFQMLATTVETTRSLPSSGLKVRAMPGGSAFFRDVKEINARYKQNLNLKNDNMTSYDSDDEEVVSSQKSKCSIM